MIKKGRNCPSGARHRGQPVIYCFSFSDAIHSQTPEQRDTSHRWSLEAFQGSESQNSLLKPKIPFGTMSWAPQTQDLTQLPTAKPILNHHQIFPISCSNSPQPGDTSHSCSHQQSSGCCWKIWENVSWNFCS